MRVGSFPGSFFCSISLWMGFDDCSFITYLEIRKYDASSVAALAQNCFAIWDLLWFYMSFRIFICFCKKCQDVQQGCIESVDNVGRYRLLMKLITNSWRWDAFPLICARFIFFHRCYAFSEYIFFFNLLGCLFICTIFCFFCLLCFVFLDNIVSRIVSLIFWISDDSLFWRFLHERMNSCLLLSLGSCLCCSSWSFILNRSQI